MIKTLLYIALIMMGVQDMTPMKDKETFEKKLNEVSENTSSIKCEFVQKKHLSFSKEPLVSKGEMYYQDQLMRWEQSAPKDYLMIITDEELKIKEDGKIRTHGLSENKYMKGIKEIMVGSMTGNLLNSDQFKTELFESDIHWIVQLKPKVRRMKKMFEEVLMKFDRKSYRMKEIILNEPNGDHTVIEFINPIFNTAISPDKFEIKE